METYLGTINLFAGSYAPQYFQLCAGQTLPLAQNQALYAVIGTTFGGVANQNFMLPDFRGRVPIGVGAGPGLTVIALAQALGSNSGAIAAATATVTVPALPVTLNNLSASGVLNANQLPAHTHAINAQTVSIAIPATAGASASLIPTGLTNVPSPATTLAQGTATSLPANAADIYSTAAANTTLKAFNLTIAASTSGSTGAGTTITLPVTGTAATTPTPAPITVPANTVSVMQPSLGVNFIICTQGLFPSRN